MLVSAEEVKTAGEVWFAHIRHAGRNNEFIGAMRVWNFTWPHKELVEVDNHTGAIIKALNHPQIVDIIQSPKFKIWEKCARSPHALTLFKIYEIQMGESDGVDEVSGRE